jgi:hypothetical protein
MAFDPAAVGDIGLRLLAIESTLAGPAADALIQGSTDATKNRSHQNHIVFSISISAARQNADRIDLLVWPDDVRDPLRGSIRQPLPPPEANWDVKQLAVAEDTRDMIRERHGAERHSC